MSTVQTKLTNQQQYEGAMYINGRALPVQNPIPIPNPARLTEVVGTIPKGSIAECHMAIEAAQAAFPAWAALSIHERARTVATAYEAFMPGMDDRAVLLSRENGKTRIEAWFDCMGAKRCVDYYVNLSKDFELEWEPPAPNGRVVVTRKPMGVAGIIVPWNAPVLLAYLGIAPALIAGNTVVVKPSNFVPLALIDTVRLMAEYLPPGVLNVITGPGAAIGKELASHPLVRRMIFTGSVEVGKQVLLDAASTVKRCTMELGGNDPAIVLPDANLDTAVPGILRAVFTGAGQICYDVKRIYVQKDIYSQFVKCFTEAADEIVVGNGLDPNVTMGSITTKEQYNFVNDLIAESKAGSGKVTVVGKKAVSEEEWKNGYFILPHIVTGVDHRHRVVTCEQFGPIIPIISFDTEEEAVRLANDSEFGLASSIWTEDIEHAWELARKIDAGTTFVNTHAVASAVDMPFGGFKWSGLGRSHGVIALEEQYELQTLSTRKLQGGN
ncbi:MAG: aldehyde dehydrogenase family protein [Acidobacteria bacterium]|nr:aldehyde dehydrogenase family protein [Acidobacteriota bacterium]